MTGRRVGRVVGLVVLALVCGVAAFYAFLIGMMCEPDAGVGCDGADAERTRQLAYAGALVAAGIGAGALAAAVKPHAAAVAGGSLAGLAAVGYAITQVN